MNFSAAISTFLPIVAIAQGNIGLDGGAAPDRPTGGAGGKSLRRQEDSRYDDAPPPLNTGSSYNEVIFNYDIHNEDYSSTNDNVEFFFYAGDKLMKKHTEGNLHWQKWFWGLWFDGSTGWLKVEASLGTLTHVDVFIIGQDAALIDQAWIGFEKWGDAEWKGFGMKGERGYCLSTDTNDSFGWYSSGSPCSPGLQFRYDTGEVFMLHHGPPSSSGLLLA